MYDAIIVGAGSPIPPIAVNMTFDLGPFAFFSAITGSLPLPAFMNPENIGRIVAGAKRH